MIPSIPIHLTHANVQESVGKPWWYMQLIKTHESLYKVLQVMWSVPGIWTMPEHAMKSVQIIITIVIYTEKNCSFVKTHAAYL